MRGAKPKLDNVIPMKSGATAHPSPAVLARKLCPRGVTKIERKEWMRVATLLAEPSVDRLKPLFVDTIIEYCRATIRLREIRQFFIDKTAADKLARDLAAPRHVTLPGSPVCEHPLAAEVYEVQGRNGAQLKAHPHVAQMNEVWRQWRSLMMELGLSPTSERNMIPGQGDLFDDPASEFYGG